MFRRSLSYKNMNIQHTQELVKETQPELSRLLTINFLLPSWKLLPSSTPIKCITFQFLLRIADSLDFPCPLLPSQGARAPPMANCWTSGHWQFFIILSWAFTLRLASPTPSQTDSDVWHVFALIPRIVWCKRFSPLLALFLVRDRCPTYIFMYTYEHLSFVWTHRSQVVQACHGQLGWCLGWFLQRNGHAVVASLFVAGLIWTERDRTDRKKIVCYEKENTGCHLLGCSGNIADTAGRRFVPCAVSIDSVLERCLFFVDLRCKLLVTYDPHRDFVRNALRRTLKQCCRF